MSGGYTQDDYTEGILIERFPNTEEIENEIATAIEEQLGVFIYDTDDSNVGKFKDTTFFIERELGKRLPERGTIKVGKRDVKWRRISLE